MRFGDAILQDDSVTLIKHNFLVNEPIRYSWGQVHTSKAGGVFYISAVNEKKAYVGLSYINSPNTHVLEQAIQMAFKKPGMQRLSDVLKWGCDWVLKIAYQQIYQARILDLI